MSLELDKSDVMCNKTEIEVNRNLKKFEICKICGHNIWECFQNYSSHTSIHGVQYLGEKNRPWWEKIFWILVFGVSISLCVNMIFTEWKRWDESPVIVSFDNRETDIWKIPFPAVTICPQSKIAKHFIENETFMTKANFVKVNFACSPKYFFHDTNEEKDYRKYIFENYKNASTNIFDYFAPKTYFGITWNDMVLDESDLNNVITDDGKCFSFNSFNYMDLYKGECNSNLNIDKYCDSSECQWNRFKGYDSKAGFETYPRRIFGSGKQRGLEIIMLHLTEEIDQLFCPETVPGFKILVHPPDDVPIIHKHFFHLPFGQEVIAAVKPKMIKTSNVLRSYSSRKRQCVFDDEIKLAYFKSYTKNNCEIECLVNHTLKQCNCISFYIPQISNKTICGSEKDFDCMKNVESNLWHNDLIKLINSSSDRHYDNNNDDSAKNGPNYETMYEEEDYDYDYYYNNYKEYDDGNRNQLYSCKCLPPCTSIGYDLEISHTNFNIQKSLGKNYNKYQEIFMTNHYIKKYEKKMEDLFNKNEWTNFDKLDKLLDTMEQLLDDKENLNMNFSNYLNSSYVYSPIVKMIIKKYGSFESDTISKRISASKLTMYFAEDSFLSSKRSELYGTSSFLSNVGGLLGLFMGISALSFIEIFYFSTIRVISDYIMKKKKCKIHNFDPDPEH